MTERPYRHGATTRGGIKATIVAPSGATITPSESECVVTAPNFELHFSSRIPTVAKRLEVMTECQIHEPNRMFCSGYMGAVSQVDLSAIAPGLQCLTKPGVMHLADDAAKAVMTACESVKAK